MKPTSLLWAVAALLLSHLVCFALPDLTPVSLQVPPGVTNSPFPTVSISWTVSNQGTTSAAGYYDGIYVSTNAVLDTNVFPFSTWYVGSSTAPGDSYSGTNTLVLLLGFSGKYYVWFKTDIYNSLQESDDNNNTIVSPLDFQARPADLAPVSFLVPPGSTVPPFPYLNLIWSVTNLGPGTATGGWPDSLYLSSKPELGPDASLLGVFYPPTLLVSAGGIYWQTNLLRLPVTTNGTYYFILRVDEGNNLYEANFSNNVLSVPVTFDVQSPDLAALPLQAPSHVTSLANPVFPVIWGVTNPGPTVAQGGWSDQLFLSTNNVLDGTSEVLLTTTSESGPVPPGRAYWRTNQIQFPVRRSGAYYLIFRTDAQYNLLESTFTNNLAVLPITFDIQQPDLTPLAFQVPLVVTSPPNPSLTLSWGVTNQGAGSTTGYWYDRVYLSQNPVLDSPDVSVFSAIETTPLDTGEDYWRTNMVQLPITQSGAYYLIFETDDGNWLNESDTNNNVRVRPVNLTIQPPNLAPIVLQVPSPITSPPNPTLRVVWGVTNSGIGAASGYWYDKLYWSINPQLDPTDPVALVNSEVGPVPPGGTYWRTNWVQVPVTQSGTYYLIFAANNDNYARLFETDFADNFLSVPVTFNIQPPDLAPVATLMPNSISGPPYPSVTLVWGVTNQGIGAAAGSAWTDAIYLSSDPIWSPADPVVVSSYDYGPIPPGGTLWLTNTVRLPVTASGTNYLFLQANLNNQFFESDYSNNLVGLPIRFEVTPPDLAPIALQVPTNLSGPPYPDLTVVWGVTNQGTGSAIGNWAWSDHLYLSTNAVWDSTASDVFWLTETGPVNPGQSYWRTNTFHLPITGSGQYYLFFEPNGQQELVESDYHNNLTNASFSFTVQPPDLAPVSVQVPRSVTGPPYPSVTYVWGVTNQGAGDAVPFPGSWVDVVTLSTNAAWNPADYHLQSDYQYSSLSPGQVSWHTNTLRMPVTQSGNYYLVFNCDAYQGVIESDDSNNIVAVPISFNIQPPDLAPLALQVPQSITSPPNPSLTVVWGVTNQGTGPAIGFDYWADQLYLSTDPVWDWQDLQLANQYESGPIASGQTYWRTNSVTVPVTQSGDYFLIFKTDGNSSLFESDESNNTLVLPVTFNIRPPDLAPVPPTGPLTITGPPNPNFTLVWGVTNLGAGAAIGSPAWNNLVYFSKNARLDSQDSVIGSAFQSGPIDPGGVAWQTNSVWAPVVQSGDYYLIFEANSGGYNRLFESDYSNNLAVIPVTFNIQRPDLAPVALQVPAKITSPPNPTFTLVWGITNQGVGPATSQFTYPTWSDGLYLSTNATLDPDARWLTAAYPPGPIPPGGSYWTTNSLTLPVTQSGTYYLILRADDNSFLYESDYSNNTLAIPVTFTILPPDLCPVSLRAASQVTSTPNPRVSISWGITNLGVGTAQGSWSDVLYLSTNRDLDNNAVAIDFAAETGPVPAGGSYWRTNLLQLPVVQSGSYFLTLKANDAGYLFESNVTNNSLSIPLTFTILPPDLAPLTLEALSQVTGPPNPTLHLSWGITNQGSGTAGGRGFWTDRIYLSTTPQLNLGFSQAIMTRYQQEPIPPGGQYWASQWVQVPVTTDGTYYLILQTDGDNALYESDENNNSLVVPVTFKIQRPDLAPITLQAPAAVVSAANPELKLTWGVTNQGVGAATGSWQDYLYLSTDAVLDGSNTLITSRWEGGPLPAGGSYWRAGTVQVPVVKSGKYYLILQPAGGYLAGVTNNWLATPVTFEVGVPDLAPVAFQAPAELTVPPNPSITLVWGVTNQGPGLATSANSSFSWYDRIFLATNATPDLQNTPVIFSASAPDQLPSGGTYWRTNTVRLPVTDDGTYYLIFQANADSYRPVYESDFSNNFAVAQLKLHVLAPDLAPLALIAPTNLNGAQFSTVTLTWGVTNQGPGWAIGTSYGWIDSVSLTKTNPIDGSSATLASWSFNQTNAIAPGQSYWSSNSVQLPIFENGIYELTLTADTSNTLGETNTANNSMSIAFSANVTPPDVAPIVFLGPRSVSGPPNPSVTLIWGATNQAAVAAGSPVSFWDDQVYLSTNAFLDGSAVYVQDWPQNGIVPAGGSYWRTNTVPLPLRSAGNYFLILRLDAYGALHELNVSNNLAVLPFTFDTSPSADLAPIGLQVPSTINGPPHPTVTFAWGVTNQGAGVAEARFGWYDELLLGVNPALDGTESVVALSSETNGVLSGGVYWRTNSLTVPVDATGKYYLSFMTDPQATVVESDYGNNNLTVPVTFNIVPPDLAPLVLLAPGSVTGAPNPTVTVVIGVTNEGAGDALPAADALYVSATPFRDASARLATYFSRTNPVPPGGAYWITNSVRLPVADGGNYYLLFEADADNALGETEPQNNLAVAPIRLELSLQPDLALKTLQWPSVVTGPPNPTVQMVWQTANEGLGPAVAPWTDTVVLFTNEFAGQSVVLGSVVENDSLAVGMSDWRTNVFTLPLTQSGGYVVNIQINAPDDLVELNFDNNGQFRYFTFVLTNPPAVGLVPGRLLADGSFVLGVAGAVGASYTVQASTDLIQWVRVMDLLCTNVPTWVVDQEAAGPGHRFYRVVPYVATNGSPLQLSIGSDLTSGPGTPRLRLDGPLSLDYRIQTSANLTDWVTLTNLAKLQRAPVYILDESAANSPGYRFYRALTP